MDEDSQEVSAGDPVAATVPESPKPLAFTIDFGGEKKVDSQRHKSLAEKFQKRHKRGQSMSKLEDSTTTTPPKQHPLTGNLPRKSSFQSEGYFSSDEKTERAKSAKANAKRTDLTLLLKNVTSDRMTQSFPNAALPCITSPEECDLKDISSPELDLISPFSPREQEEAVTVSNKKYQQSSPSVEVIFTDDNVFVDGNDFNFDNDKKSDTLSDAGTYTIDADNYSEEQKAKMSIDRDFKIETVSVLRKTEEYVRSLAIVREQVLEQNSLSRPVSFRSGVVGNGDLTLTGSENKNELKSPVLQVAKGAGKVLSPILSPTQNLSIAGEKPVEKPLNNGECDLLNKTFTKIMFPSQQSKQDGLGQNVDQGTIISVTSSGAFRSKTEEKKKFERKLSLTKSEVQVQAYIDGNIINEEVKKTTTNNKKLTANIVNVQSIEVKTDDSSTVVNACLVFGKVSNGSSGLPPVVGGKTSPTKIPSPMHTMSRPRSRNSFSSMNVELSDSSLDTEIILKPTQNYINSLQQRLSMDSDPDSDYDAKYGLQLNNTAHLLKQRASHTRHNSLDDRTINNKLEHFQNKNLQGIDQTYSNLLNQYSQNKIIHKIQNSPNNSPIRRSSSFSTKNQINSMAKNTNITTPQKGSNICNSPNLTRNTLIQRSSSTACIKPNHITHRRSSITDHKKIDRSQFGDTESSSEEDFEKNLQKRKDLGNISNTRCNRAFSLRRARVDNEPGQLKCPNTPEMRRKTFQADVKQERAISVDRKPMKTNEVQSRYLLNISKRNTPPPASKDSKNVPKLNVTTPNSVSKATNKPQVFSRTDSGRFSMRTTTTTTKPPVSGNTPKSGKKDGKKQGGGARSNSSLSCREVEFQNWKRRKSYDPMKAAAEGKKKEVQKRQGLSAQGGHSPMTQSFTEANHSSPQSSPSHSSSVHRSQSFHGTAALEQLISSDEEEDLTLSAEEDEAGFSPPTPSPCELSPARATLRHHALWERRNLQR